MLKISEILKAVKGKPVCWRKDVQIEGISIDSRTVKKGDCFIAVKGNNFDGHDFIPDVIRKGASCIIKDGRSFNYAQCGLKCSGQALRQSSGQAEEAAVIEVDDTIKALGCIARYQRRKMNKPVIAVTGSAGKTTVKDMIFGVLSKRFNVLSNEGTKNNHIGVPLTLMRLMPEHDIAVLELGTNHPGEIEYLAKICEPNLGVITNVGPSHLEYFTDLTGVLKEKTSLLNNLKAPRIAVLNADDELLSKRIFKESNKQVLFGFGVKGKGDFCASGIKSACGKLSFYVNDSKKKITLNTLGTNNVNNALAAVAAARIMGLEYDDISSALSSFDFPLRRLNFIVLNKVNFIDDTYNSNPLSLKQALDALDSCNVRGRKIFVMGDMLELGCEKESYHSQAGQLAAGVCDVFITVGKLSNYAACAAKSCGLPDKAIFSCDSTSQARQILYNKVSPNEKDVVLIKGSRGMRMEEIL